MHKLLMANLSCSLPIISKAMSAPCVLTIATYDFEAHRKKYAATRVKTSTILITIKRDGSLIGE
jgi:hypothetical protein